MRRDATHASSNNEPSEAGAPGEPVDADDPNPNHANTPAINRTGSTRAGSATGTDIDSEGEATRAVAAGTLVAGASEGGAAVTLWVGADAEADETVLVGDSVRSGFFGDSRSPAPIRVDVGFADESEPFFSEVRRGGSSLICGALVDGGFGVVGVGALDTVGVAVPEAGSTESAESV